MCVDLLSLYVHVYVYVYAHVGLNITEVAHDYHTQLRTYITQELKLLNSFDTWHGMYMYAQFRSYVM